MHRKTPETEGGALWPKACRTFGISKMHKLYSVVNKAQVHPMRSASGLDTGSYKLEFPHRTHFARILAYGT